MLRHAAIIGTLALWALAACGDDATQDVENIVASDPCSECVPDQVCLGGRCLDAPACGCEFGEYCDEALGDVCVVGCRVDAECGLGALCDDGDCVPGCRSDASCAVGSRCFDGSCRRGCRITDECGFGQACLDGYCRDVACRADADCDEGSMCDAHQCIDVGPAPCTDDAECGFLWRCSLDGECARCLDDTDCPAHLSCIDATCAPGEMPTVSFEPVDLGPVQEHGQSLLGPDDLGYGAGLALLDYDGDGDLDVAVARHAADDPAVCVYENLSEPGAFRFEPMASVCELDLAGWGVAGADFDRDGVDELVVMGSRSVSVVSGGDAPSVDVLFDDTEAERSGLTCSAGSAVAVDIDLDGDLDLYVGCQANLSVDNTREMRYNLVFEQRADGSFSRLDLPRAHPLVDEGVTLAIGVIDLDDDGLLDMVLANDSYSTVGRRNLALGPGTRLHRCAPDEVCTWQASNFTRGEDSWGSFMGVGYVLIEGSHYVYVSDWGPNRMLSDSTEPTDDVAADFGLELARRDGYNLFGWSVVVEDFDRDGRDDLLVSHGMVLDPTVPRAQYVHVNALVLQQAQGTFRAWTEGTGLLAPSERTSTEPEVAASSRAVLRADLDGDGRLDLLTSTFVGYPEAYTVQHSRTVTPRCTLRPVTTVVHAHGYGYGVRESDDSPFHFRDVQGHIRSGASPFVMTSTPTGQLRFPSGAVVNFDCTTGPRASDVVEPTWIQRVPASDAPRFTLDPTWVDGGSIASISAVARHAGVTDVYTVARDPAADEYVVVGAPAGADVMLRINDRWVPRWFSAP